MLLSDTRFSARFRRRRSRRGPRGPRLPRVLLVMGVLIMVSAAFLGLSDAFLQGLVLAVAGLLWKKPWPRLPRRDDTPPTERARRLSRPLSANSWMRIHGRAP